LIIKNNLLIFTEWSTPVAIFGAFLITIFGAFSVTDYTKALQANKASNEKPITNFLLATEASVQPEFHGLAYGHHETLAVIGCFS